MITVMRWRTLLLFAVLTLAALLAGLTLALFVFSTAHAEPHPPPEPGPWVNECALCPRWFADLTPQAMQTDSTGVIHVVYGGDALYHAWDGPSGWSSEVADATPGVGRFAALAIDSTGGLHVVYYDVVNKQLRYAVKQGTAWHTEPIVDIVPDVDLPGYAANMYPSIAVDSAGRPRVAFYRPIARNLAFAVRGLAGWPVETVDAGPDVGSYASLALDQAGKAHIAYRDAANARLRYAVQTDSGWLLETVSPAGEPVRQMGQDAALALDAADQPQIVVRLNGEPAPHVLYLFKQDNAWRSEGLPGECYQMHVGQVQANIWGCGSHAVVRVASDGTVYVAYSYAYTGNPWAGVPDGERLRYLVRTAGNWTATEVGANGAQALLALPLAGNPVVAGLSRGKLTAYQSGSQAPGQPWPSREIDAGGDPGPRTALALDQAGQVHVAAMDSVQQALRYTIKTAGGWEVEATPDVTPEVMPALKLSLGPTGRAEVLYDQQVVYGAIGLPSARLTQAWQYGATWYQVARDHLVGTAAALAVDLTGASHLAYAANEGMVYAPGLLTSPPVLLEPGPPQGGRWPSAMAFAAADLAVDAQGRPHLAYARADEAAVRYATVRAGAWITATVASRLSNEFFVYGVAVAVGPGGVPQIVLDGGDYGIALARPVGDHWQVNQLAAGRAATQPDIAVDANGGAHVSYYDSNTGSLMYVRIEPDGSAMTSLVAAGGYAGQGSSIALDGAGRPHIAYYDALGHDVRHVYVPFVATDAAYLPAVRK